MAYVIGVPRTVWGLAAFLSLVACGGGETQAGASASSVRSSSLVSTGSGSSDTSSQLTVSSAIMSSFSSSSSSIASVIPGSSSSLSSAATSASVSQSSLASSLSSQSVSSSSLSLASSSLSSSVSSVDPAFVGTGHNCDPAAYEYCRDNRLVTAISFNGETNTTTFTFGADMYIGWFADGQSRWVAPIPPATSVRIDSVSYLGPKVDGIFVDNNPGVDAQGLLPERETQYGNYVAGQTQIFPAIYSADTSVVAGLRTLYYNGEGGGPCGTSSIKTNCLRYVMPLTLLMSIPDNAGKTKVRPALSPQQKHLFDVNIDFDFSSMPSDSRLAPPANITQLISRWIYTIESLSIGDSLGSHHSEGGRAFRSEWLTDDYAAAKAQRWYSDWFALATDRLTPAEKTPALAAMLAHSMDLFFAAFDCNQMTCTPVRPMQGGAGQGQGKGPAAALFATFATDAKYKAAFQGLVATRGRGFPETNDPYPAGYQEITQINSGPNGPVWGDYPDPLTTAEGGFADEGFRRYWAAVHWRKCYAGAPSACLGAGTGKRTARDPYGYHDGPGEEPGAGYVSVTSGGYRALAVKMEMWPEFKAVINYPEIVQYARRLHYVGLQTTDDVCAPPDPREASSCDPWKLNSAAGTQCLYFGAGANTKTSIVTWGSDPRDATRQTCVRNSTTCTLSNATWSCVPAVPGDANYGQAGRFPSYHGTQVSKGNTVQAAEALFTQMIPSFP